MKDAEFYTLEENWPQPPDDGCTLEPIEPQAPVRGKKKKSSGRVRKKLSESLAGVTAAALTIVMVATAVPALKDAFGDLSDLPNLGDNHSCPTCGKAECPYHVEGVPGLNLELFYETENNGSDDIYSMSGLCADDEIYLGRNYNSITTADGDRLVLRFRYEFYKAYNRYSNASSGEEILSYYPSKEDNTVLTGLCWYGDQNVGDEDGYLYAVLVYDPDGSVPLVDPEMVFTLEDKRIFDPKAVNYHVQDIPGVRYAQLQIVSNLEDSVLEELATYLDVVTVKGLQQYPLGETMVFTETEDRLRSFEDIRYGGVRHTDTFVTEKGNELHRLHYSVATKEYTLETFGSGVSIGINGIGYDRVFEYWKQLNDDAPKTGHHMDYPIKQLQDVTVNAITYSSYAVYSAMTVNLHDGYHTVWLYLVPQQEKTVAVEIRATMLPEELRSLIEDGVMDKFSVEEMLDQISLR